MNQHFIRILADEHNGHPFDKIVRINAIDQVRVQAGPDATNVFKEAQNITIEAAGETYTRNFSEPTDIRDIESKLKGAGLFRTLEGFVNLNQIVHVELVNEAQYEIWGKDLSQNWGAVVGVKFLSGSTGSHFTLYGELLRELEKNWTNL